MTKKEKDQKTKKIVYKAKHIKQKTKQHNPIKNWGWSEVLKKTRNNATYFSVSDV